MWRSHGRQEWRERTEQPKPTRAERIAAQDGNCQTNEQRASSRGTREFHNMQHANEAIDEVRRAEFFRKGGRMRGVVKGKRWLLLSRWANLTAGKRQELNQLFASQLESVQSLHSQRDLWTGYGPTTTKARC